MHEDENLVLARVLQNLAVQDLVHDLVALDRLLLVDADVRLRERHRPETEGTKINYYRYIIINYFVNYNSTKVLTS